MVSSDWRPVPRSTAWGKVGRELTLTLALTLTLMEGIAQAGKEQMAEFEQRAVRAVREAEDREEEIMMLKIEMNTIYEAVIRTRIRIRIGR